VEERGDGELELASVWADGGGVLGVRGGELAREREECVAGCTLVLRRARDGELGLSPKLATAAARWRPRSSTRRRGEGMRDPARRGVGPRGHGGAACGGGDAGAGLRPSSAAGGAALRWRQRKQGGRSKMKVGPSCKF
jgi:hypothetical protein